MTQNERRLFLLNYLVDENTRCKGAAIPENESEQRMLLRSLMNVREPVPASSEFLKIQDEYLGELIKSRGITELEDLTALNSRGGGDFYLWRGDITLLKVDAIVNAANSGMTGCWQPCHSCIDNCIHTFSGIQLRAECADIMRKQGHEEPTGRAKITRAYNLPCSFVLHTVGPIISGALTKADCELLASCYKSCLELADENGVKSIAFCCISTGVFHFPAERAAEIAVSTVEEWKARKKSPMKIVFNVFSEKDEAIYKQTLGLS